MYLHDYDYSDTHHNVWSRDRGAVHVYIAAGSTGTYTTSVLNLEPDYGSLDYMQQQQQFHGA